MSEKNGFYKTASTHLVAVLATGVAAWFSFGGGIDRTEALSIADHAAADAVDSVPSRDDVSQMIQTESPYVADKSGIEERLKNIERMVTRIDRNLNQ